MTLPPNNIVTYEIDAGDRISTVGGEWTAFAAANSGAGLPADTIAGRLLWDSIAAMEVRFVWQRIVARSRATQTPICLHSRCDSPDCRRLIEIAVHPLPDGALRFESTIIREDARPPVLILDETVARGGDYVKMCSMCHQFECPPHGWLEIEDAVNVLDLMNRDAFPNITHGLCGPCYEEAMESANEDPQQPMPSPSP